MKRQFARFFAAALLFGAVACNNEKTEQKEEKTTVSPTKTAGEAKKTEISVGPNGGSVKTRDGKEVELDKSGARVGTKDVNVKVNTKDTTKN